MQTVHAIESVSHGPETVVCRSIALRHNDSEVLLIVRDGRCSVPMIEVPRWQRVAPHLVEQVRRMWGLETICRFSLTDENTSDGSRFVVLDALDVSGHTPDGTAWVPVDGVVWEHSESSRTCDGFHRTLQKVREYSLALVPFSRPGWFAEVTGWVQSQLNLYRLRLNGRWTQYNMGPVFSLVHYETNDLPVWFKAVGEPNLREFHIHGELAKLRSPHLPETLAVHPGWHGWLMLGTGGRPLDRTASIEHWKTAARSLAELQIESVPACESLLAAGCDDLRMTELRRRIEPFVHMNEQLMAMQPATPPPILSQDDLRFIEVHLQRAIDEIEMLGMPYAIGHSDLNPGNVLVNDTAAVFLAWMQGHIGHPVVTFEYLLALLGRLRPDCESWRQAIMNAYFDVWKSTYSDSEARMVRALQLAPLVAPFAFAVSCCPDWNMERTSTELQKLMRALARRMFAAAQKLT